MRPVRQLHVLDYHPITITATQAVTHDLAVATPQGLNILDMEYLIRTRSLTGDFLELPIHVCLTSKPFSCTNK